MRYLISVLLFFIVISLSGQSLSPTKTGEWYQKLAWQKKNEPASYFQFTKNFVEIFNGDDMSKILEISSDELKTDIDPQKMIGFLNFFKNDFGNIDSLHFKYFDKRNQRTNPVDMAVYTLTFEKGSKWELRLELNEEGQLNKYIITDNNYNESAPIKFSQLKMYLPFKENQTWFVLWGGETHEENYHVVSKPQKNAIDFLIKNPWSNRTYKNEGTENSDYYAFDQPLYSPIDGTVIKVIDSIPDNEPGVMNPKNLTGNTVVIKSGNEYLLMAHFKLNSIKVKEGQKIEKGDLLGKCGNSGNSSEPHLHIQVMDQPEMRGATGLKILFEEMELNGVSKVFNYSPVRGNYVSHLP